MISNNIPSEPDGETKMRLALNTNVMPNVTSSKNLSTHVVMVMRTMKAVLFSSITA